METCGVISVSYHLPNYILISGKAKQKVNNDRPLTRFIPRNMQKFQHMISSIVFDDIYQSRDVNECFELFEAKLSTCYNVCFPLVRLSRKCVRDKKWVTCGIKLCSRKKNKLYKQWLLTGK